MGRISVRAVIELNDRYLLVSNKVAGDFWHLPGGRVEDGENVEAALIREIEEEIGITPKIGNLLAIHQIKIEDTWWPVSLIFHITNPEDFAHFDIETSTHRSKELDSAAFVQLEDVEVKPEALINLLPDLKKEGFNGKCRAILS